MAVKKKVPPAGAKPTSSAGAKPTPSTGVKPASVATGVKGAAATPKKVSHVKLKGTERVAAAGAKAVGDVNASELAVVTLRLKRKSSVPDFEADLTALMTQPIADRKYLTQDQLADTHGAPAESVAKIDAFAHAHNLTVVETSLAKRTVKLQGTLGDLQAAFQVKLRNFKSAHSTYRGRVGSIFIPADLQDVIEGVYGLDNRPAAKPHISFKDPGRAARGTAGQGKNVPGKKPGQKAAKAPGPGVKARDAAPSQPVDSSLSVTDVAALYNFPPGLDGSGQTIALLELNAPLDPSKPTENVGSGYSLDDLNQFFTGLGVKAPQITAVSVDGGANLPNVNPDADGEVELDIEVAGGVAPGANIAVYFAPNTDQGFIDGLSAAIHDTVRKPSIVSISWGGPEDFATQQFIDGINAALQDAVALGITVCVAAGDSGSSDLPAEYASQAQYQGPHVDFPASSPYVVACGGTKLAGSAGSIASEVVWNEGRQYGAGGGGVSSNFALPAWQAGAGVPNSPKGTPGRGSPDVAGNADPITGYRIVLQAQEQPIGGTSAVAPLWAGLFARINQQLAAAGKPSLGFVNALLYGLPASANAFHDITYGNNDIDGNLGKYAAGPGWDACTGLGSPNGAALMAALV